MVSFLIKNNKKNNSQNKFRFSFSCASIIFGCLAAPCFAQTIPWEANINVYDFMKSKGMQVGSVGMSDEIHAIKPTGENEVSIASWYSKDDKRPVYKLNITSVTYSVINAASINEMPDNLFYSCAEQKKKIANNGEKVHYGFNSWFVGEYWIFGLDCSVENIDSNKQMLSKVLEKSGVSPHLRFYTAKLFDDVYIGDNGDKKYAIFVKKGSAYQVPYYSDDDYSYYQPEDSYYFPRKNSETNKTTISKLTRNEVVDVVEITDFPDRQLNQVLKIRENGYIISYQKYRNGERGAIFFDSQTARYSEVLSDYGFIAAKPLIPQCRIAALSQKNWSFQKPDILVYNFCNI